MRILGVDYGSKRVGIAISDELGVLARELEVVGPKHLQTRLLELVGMYEVGEIVVGLPLGMQGQETKKTEETRKFISNLRTMVSVAVKTFDERMTTQMALKVPGGKKGTDSLAAQFILQMYLDSNKDKS